MKRRAIRLSAKEKHRMCIEGGITVAVRPQSIGGYAVHVVTREGFSVAKPHVVKTKREVSAVVQDMLRMLHKCAWPGGMAERSRHRERAR